MQTDYRLRGFSISDEQPAASVAVGYDDPSGVYVGGATGLTVRDGEPEPLLVEAHAGYATRVAPNLSLDLGVAHTRYFSAFGTYRDYEYTEVYVGLALPHVSARIAYSPNYLFPDTESLYAEVNTGVEPAADWFFSAHAGALIYADNFTPQRWYDWRLGVSRQFRRIGVHADVSGRIPSEPSGRAVSDTAAVLTVTLAI